MSEGGMISTTAIMQALAGVGLIGGAGMGGLQWNDTQVEVAQEANALLVKERESMRSTFVEQIAECNTAAARDRQEAIERYDALVERTAAVLSNAEATDAPTP